MACSLAGQVTFYITEIENMLDAGKFRSEAMRINPQMGRFKKSALAPILELLGNHQRTHLSPKLRDDIQELIFHIPHDRQTKYATALKVLESDGLKICGRPVDPRMEFVRFDQGDYSYVGRDNSGAEKMIVLKPGSLHHVFDFKWKSSTGSLQSLTKVWTQEHIKFRTSQRGIPFNDVMSNDMEFTWGKTNGASAGFGRDDHSMKPPRLVCRFPFQEGWNIAEQWYQYSMDGTNWKNIPGAAFLIHKGVRQSKGQWVFAFKKTNWAPHNNRSFKFEAEYPIGGPLECPAKPGQQWMRTNGTKAEISEFGRLISKS